MTATGRSARWRSLVIAAAFAACAACAPFPTTPTPADPGAPAGQRVAICYSTLHSSLPEVQAQAQQECAAGTVAQPVGTDWYLLHCPLLLPAHATFACLPKR